MPLSLPIHRPEAPPAQVLPRPRPSPALKDIVAPAVSLLCFVHCVGMALLAPLLPGALAALADNESLEWVLVGLSISLAAWFLWRSRRQIGVMVIVVGAASGGATITGLLAEAEMVQRIGLAGLALAQLGVLATRFRAHRTCGCGSRDAAGSCCGPR